jgi:hypothetical protein
MVRQGPAVGVRFRGHVKRNEKGPIYWTSCTITQFLSLGPSVGVGVEVTVADLWPGQCLGNCNRWWDHRGKPPPLAGASRPGDRSPGASPSCVYASADHRGIVTGLRALVSCFRNRTMLTRLMAYLPNFLTRQSDTGTVVELS